MRIALVSPYSWTYPGGVTRHIEALAEQFIAGGHDVRVLAPFDPPDRLSARLHRGARPQARELPGLARPARPHDRRPSNGAVSNLAHTPYAVTTLRRELRAGRLRRRPRARAGRAGRRLGRARHRRPRRSSAPSTATPRTSSPNNDRQRASARGASSTACTCASPSPRPPPGPAGASTAAATASSPTASTCPAEPPAPRRGRRARRCGSPSSARPSSARACRCCCAPSRRCATTSPVELTIVGADRDEVAPLLLDGTRASHALGKVSDDARRPPRWPRPTCSCAPSLGGESFGMVLTEAFAAGTPVVASDIAGYRDVVRDGVDGVLVPRGDATALAEALRDLALAPERRARDGREAPRAARRATPGRASPPRSSRPTSDAIAVPRAADRARARRACSSAPCPADLGAAPARRRRLPSLEASKREGRDRRRAAARRAGIGLAAARPPRSWPCSRCSASALDQIGDSLLRATPDLGPRSASALMCALDGRARRRLARDPPRGAARGARCALATPCRARPSAC